MSDRIDTQILKARISVKIRQLEDKAMQPGNVRPVHDEDRPTIEDMPDPEVFRSMLRDSGK